MRPVTGAHPAVEFHPEGGRLPVALTAQARRRGLLLRLLAATVAVMLLLLLWRPVVVRAQGRPSVLVGPGPGGMVEAAPAPRAAGRGTPAPRASTADPQRSAGAPPAPVILERAGAAGSEGAEEVPYGGALVVEAPRADAVDSGRLALLPQGGRDLGPRSVRVIGLVGADEMTAARTSDEGYTVFRRLVPDAAEAERSARALLTPDVPDRRVWEHQSAPFPVAAARLARGAIVGTMVVSARASAAFPRRYRIDDEVSWRVTGDGVVRVGDRLTSVVTAGDLGGPLRVAVPTGVVEVVRVGRGVARGVVRSQFAVIADGQPLLPVPSQAAPWVAADGARASDLEARVRWVQEAGRLLAPQGFVLLDVGAGHGVRPGDRFVLHRRPARGGTTGAVVAVARVVRVDAAYSAARISDLLEADGAPDRLLARRVARAGGAESRAGLP